MAISKITYNGNVLAETEESKSVVISYGGKNLTSLVGNETKTIKCAGKIMKSNLYIGAKTLLCEMSKMISDVIVEVVGELFVSEPSAYNLIGTYTASQTFTAPEDGYFQIEVFGASGSGGNGTLEYYTDSDYIAKSGSGGGGGGYACSRIKMNKGDTIVLTVGAVGAITSVSINSSLETYSTLSVTSGANGTTNGTGGVGGVASGGNYANKNGGIGGNGKQQFNFAPVAGGTGGVAGYTGGNVGGVGGAGDWGGRTGGVGKAGFIKIYRGDTNVVDNTNTEKFTRLNYIEATGTQYIDTGCAPSNNTKVIIKLTPMASGMAENAIFGSTWSANGFFLMFYQNLLRWHSKGASVDANGVNANEEIEIICTPKQLTLNGTNYSLNGTQTDSTNPITLFYAGGYIDAKYGIFKLHSCQIYNGDALVKDYVPVLDEAGVPCLYDEVNEAYAYNNGTGTFLYG